MAYEGTINLLSNFASQKYAANLQKEAPQYKQALFNLMQAKEQALNQKTLLDRLRGAGTYQEQLEIMGQAGNEKALTELSDINQESQKLSQTRNLEVNDVLEKFDVPEKLVPMLIEGIQKTGSIPVKVAPYLKVRENGPLVTVDTGDKFLTGAAKGPFDKAIGLQGSITLLNEMEKGFLALGTGSGFGGKIEALYKTAVGSTGIDFTEYSSFSKTSQSIAVLLARELGDKGNIAVAERAINADMMPKATDNYEQGMNKVKNLRSILNAVKDENYAVASRLLKAAGIEWTLIDDTKGIGFSPIPVKGGQKLEEVDTPTADPLDDYLNNLLGR